MKHIVQVPGPAIVNRAVHGMVVIVVILFAFHFARLSGFAASAVAIALLVAMLAILSAALRRTVSIDSEQHRIDTTVSLLSIPLHTRTETLPGMAWVGVRSDLPDLVVEVGTPADESVEVLRFRNGFGARENEVSQSCLALAKALGLECRR
ncbi:hypothetical protein [Noviherbaspirillum sp. ST9]|uniref:hypothetical protein n=1 Tax=Noviherbaspirillum sp. ST9 TaxID=3401606 RepID=UPI003B588C56